MSKPTNFLIFVAGWFVFGPLPVAGADWPSARGNANATGATAEALPADLQLLWKHSAGESGYEATAVISAGIVYVGDVDGTFSALRLADGDGGGDRFAQGNEALVGWSRDLECVGGLLIAKQLGCRDRQ